MPISMKTLIIKKLLTILLLICATQIAMGSFTGSSDKKSSKMFSLKNFNKNFYKTASPFSLKSTYTFKGFHVTGQNRLANGEVTLNTMMRYENGNTTYIYPYKHKVISPKFKTPSLTNR